LITVALDLRVKPSGMFVESPADSVATKPLDAVMAEGVRNSDESTLSKSKHSTLMERYCCITSCDLRRLIGVASVLGELVVHRPRRM
jgi:hypothetical protein